MARCSSAKGASSTTSRSPACGTRRSCAARIRMPRSARIDGSDALGLARRPRGAHARRSRAGAGASAACCATPIPARRSIATGRSRSPMAKCPLSASRSRSCLPIAAMSPRTPPPLVAVDYDVLAPVGGLPRRAIEPTAPAVRRELDTNIAAAYKVAYGDIEAAFASAAHVFHEDALAAPRRRPPDRRPRHPRENGADDSHDGMGLDAEGARPVPIADRAARLRREPPARGNARRRRRLRPEALRLSGRYRGGRGGEAARATRSNGSRTGASTSPTRRRSATSTGRSRSRSTRTRKLLGVRGRLIHDLGAYALQDVNMPVQLAHRC